MMRMDNFLFSGVIAAKTRRKREFNSVLINSFDKSVTLPPTQQPRNTRKTEKTRNLFADRETTDNCNKLTFFSAYVICPELKTLAKIC